MAVWHQKVVFIVTLFLIFIAGQSSCHTEGEVSTWCPGLYCGRIIEDDGNFSDCGACPRGWRPDGESKCQPCVGKPTFYDWLYLGFMALIAPALHFFYIDLTNSRKIGRLIILHGSALIESALAGICTLLVLEPVGSLEVTSCPVHHLSDWYTMLYNPKPGYTTTLHCTQEVVYPLYTMVMIYYAFGLVFMMIVRPLLSAKLVPKKGAKSIYAALYFFPVLVVIQAMFAGLLYYFFPYIVLVVSVITSAVHFALFEDQDMKSLLQNTLSSPRNLIIVLCHWLLHAYSLVAIFAATEKSDPWLQAPLLCLVPFPAIFYLLTVKFTDPSRLDQLP